MLFRLIYSLISHCFCKYCYILVYIINVVVGHLHELTRQLTKKGGNIRKACGSTAWRPVEMSACSVRMVARRPVFETGCQSSTIWQR